MKVLFFLRTYAPFNYPAIHYFGKLDNSILLYAPFLLLSGWGSNPMIVISFRLEP